LADTAPVDCEPVRVLLPIQPPDAVQALALLLDQLSVDAAPDCTLLGVALRVTVGALFETVTVTDCVAGPPDPSQVSAYSVLLVRVPVEIVPLVGTPPCQPPEALQLFEPTELQVSVELPPLLTVVGEALNTTDTGVADAGAVAVAGAPALAGPVALVEAVEVVAGAGAAAADAVAALVDVGAATAVEGEVNALELEPHAASEASAANPSIDFNAYANLWLWLRRIELIDASPKISCDNFSGGRDSFRPQSLSSHI
jgi:hypothetical protein